MPAAPWAHIEIGEPLLLAIMVSGRVKRTVWEACSLEGYRL